MLPNIYIAQKFLEWNMKIDLKGKMKGFAALSLLPSIAMALGSTALICAIVLLVLASAQTQIATQTSNTSAAYNATTQGVLGVAVVPQWLSVVAIAAVGAVVLAILTGLFMGAGAGRKR